MVQSKTAVKLPHSMPADLREALSLDARALDAWKDITLLAKNEWICWVVSVKRLETRNEHIKRMVSELKEGMRRPCCWVGCIHRKDKPMSPSVRWLMNKKGKSK